METCFNYCDRARGFFSSDERKWINKIHNLKEKYPDQIRIIAEPENNDSCIYAEIPTDWLKIQPKRVYTEEQKLQMAERLRRI